MCEWVGVPNLKKKTSKMAMEVNKVIVFWSFFFFFNVSLSKKDRIWKVKLL